MVHDRPLETSGSTRRERESLFERNLRLRVAHSEIERLTRWLYRAQTALVLGIVIGVLIWFTG